ncbi:MAG: TetR/AcrR family transcriptional regulator [Candidatus Marinimicrobia bacterium]|jgi:AcrR family transcriptional regulator|nr:TetR/AcrR family transcriptional regulator [Candidatus Neomarinimicrobiota bacterium]MBT3763356.1 TetR/AcrR family transcriptional regulator [Candidatus Neomarinimicrobiota bacterium]MBT4069076.1 TetR/AcrR family transcriptional regulator [Candidatus Neomarinimicrobiota bacterium]MBT4270226.1 TetR/AcrR family transcriptional regulator [Candidatus Neomarinimicrobiota bacterium]MBT4810171.1 TetR/AcrR family transcriptional regulator [Candidatus Neomarinimicrobiota bacterium]
MENYTERQNQIIQESIQLIADKGIQGLTIKNISKAIGISEPAIYRHFENKNDIILAIISTMKESTNKELSQIDDNNATIEKIKKMIQGHTNRFINNPSLTAIIFSEEIFNNNSILAKPIRMMMRMNQNKMISMIENGQDVGDVRVDINAEQISLMVIGSFRFLVSKWHIMNFDFDLKKEVNEMLNAIEIVLKT